MKGKSVKEIADNLIAWIDADMHILLTRQSMSWYKWYTPEMAQLHAMKYLIIKECFGEKQAKMFNNKTLGNKK